MEKAIQVACGIVLHKSKVLCAQRGLHQSMALLWEFPGGKIEPGESAEACLIREIKEELNLTINIIRPLTPHRHFYPSGIHIELIPYLCVYQEGQMELAEHQDARWVVPSDLTTMTWCEADVPIVEEFLQLWNSVDFNPSPFS
jgi:8-oxo-dGTP diphosphatase